MTEYCALAQLPQIYGKNLRCHTLGQFRRPNPLFRRLITMLMLWQRIISPTRHLPHRKHIPIELVHHNPRRVGTKKASCAYMADNVVNC